MKRTHGMSRGGTTEFVAWTNMLTRCFNSRSPSFKNYGARGITVCPQWRGPRGFARFLADIGPKPRPNLWLDRIDNNGNYEPGNVRWATPKEQARNRRPRKRRRGCIDTTPSCRHADFQAKLVWTVSCDDTLGLVTLPVAAGLPVVGDGGLYGDADPYVRGLIELCDRVLP